MIIDSQVHVWAKDTPQRPWAAKSAHLREPFGYERLLVEMKEVGIDRAVLVPPAWEGDRIDVVLEAAARHPDRFAAMGRITIADPESKKLLPTWKASPGMLGIRLSFQKPERAVWLNDGSADWLWPMAEEFNIPIMMFAPGLFDVMGDIARHHPRLKLIVDHMGLAREKDADTVRTIENLIPLAELPNVYVKVSSVPLYSSEPYPYHGLHAALERLIRAFGPRRAFWGTDITRIWGLVSYRQCVTLFTEELKFLSGDDLEWIMGRGIAECLQWR